MKAVLINPEKRSIESVDINNLNDIVRRVGVVMPSSENNVNLAPLAPVFMWLSRGKRAVNYGF